VGSTASVVEVLAAAALVAVEVVSVAGALAAEVAGVAGAPAAEAVGVVVAEGDEHDPGRSAIAQEAGSSA
jgi:hypothetical protein